MVDRLNDELLHRFPTITLEEMNKVKLMNRIDTKYVTTLSHLEHLLELASTDYHIQQIEGQTNMPYYTCYFDTSSCDMFIEHQRGRKTRQKIRLRVYEGTGNAFLEVKNKNNKGRTDKKRIVSTDKEGVGLSADFIRLHSNYLPEHLLPQVQNRFRRITLVNNQLTERLTIDTSLCFRNIVTGRECVPRDIVIIELKRDGNSPSPVLKMLRELRIHPSGFSKYCVGMALTNDRVKQNRLKEKLRMIHRLCPEISYEPTGLFDRYNNY